MAGHLLTRPCGVGPGSCLVPPPPCWVTPGQAAPLPRAMSMLQNSAPCMHGGRGRVGAGLWVEGLSWVEGRRRQHPARPPWPRPSSLMDLRGPAQLGPRLCASRLGPALLPCCPELHTPGDPPPGPGPCWCGPVPPEAQRGREHGARALVVWVTGASEALGGEG